VGQGQQNTAAAIVSPEPPANATATADAASVSTPPQRTANQQQQQHSIPGQVRLGRHDARPQQMGNQNAGGMNANAFPFLRTAPIPWPSKIPTPCPVNSQCYEGILPSTPKNICHVYGQEAAALFINPIAPTIIGTDLGNMRSDNACGSLDKLKICHGHAFDCVYFTKEAAVHCRHAGALEIAATW
jgi:hypothetical protein